MVSYHLKNLLRPLKIVCPCIHPFVCIILMRVFTYFHFIYVSLAIYTSILPPCLPNMFILILSHNEGYLGGEAETQLNSLSLVIGHQANMSPKIYTSDFFISIVEFNFRIGLRRRWLDQSEAEK